jgi:hypothetical protein
MAYTVEKDWTTKSGLRAVCIFGSHGYRCGYVSVTRGHPLFGVGYNEEAPRLAEEWEKTKKRRLGKRGIIPLFCGSDTPRPEVVFDVHGSLTYSGDGANSYPAASTPDEWWFGFDCNHGGDAPENVKDGRLSALFYTGGEFRSLEYVVAEC